MAKEHVFLSVVGAGTIAMLAWFILTAQHDAKQVASLANQVETEIVADQRLADKLLAIPTGTFPLANDAIEPLPGVRYDTTAQMYYIEYLSSSGHMKRARIADQSVEFFRTNKKRFVVFANKHAKVFLHKNDCIVSYSEPSSGNSLGTSSMFPLFIPIGQ